MTYTHLGVRRFLLLVALTAPQLCLAQQLIVGSGAKLLMGDAIVEAGCLDVTVAGSVELGSGSILAARNLSVSGSLDGGSGLIELSGSLAAGERLFPQSGTVAIVDGCGSSESAIIGDHQFNRLRVTSDTGRVLVLPAAGTQTITTGLELAGGAERLVIQSSAPGTVGFLSLSAGATQTISRIDVINVGAPATGQYLAPLETAAYGSVDRGNTPRFFAEQSALISPTIVPSASVYSLLGLMLLMLGFGLFHSRTLIQGER